MRARPDWRLQQVHASAAAKVILYSIVLSVCWSPRIRFDVLAGKDVDLRLQDPLIVLALVYLAFSSTPMRARWDRIWGQLLPAFLCTAALTTVLHMMRTNAVSDLIRIAFLGRTVEIFVLAICVCGLYLRAGISAREIGRVLRVGVWANLVWIAYQYVTGTWTTLFGDVGDAIWTYGPKLIGEPSPFGTGVFLSFAAALTVADYRTGAVRRHIAIATMGAVIAASVVVESRANLLFVLATVVFLSRDRLRGFVNIPALTFFVLGVAAAFVLWGGDLVGRVSLGSIWGALEDRFQIWASVSSYVDSVVLGLGPGGMTAEHIPHTEAHNIVVRAWLDFGVLGAVLLFAVLGRTLYAARRSASPDRPRPLRWSATVAAVTLLGVFFTGTVQDALTAVTSTHLLMITVGIFAGELSRSTAVAELEETLPARHTGARS